MNPSILLLIPSLQYWQLAIFFKAETCQPFWWFPLARTSQHPTVSHDHPRMFGMVPRRS